MFGYINAFKDELKIKEYNIYRAYYCGVCHSLKKNVSFLSRFGLSYDISFMALLLDSLQECKTDASLKRCMVHPFEKRAVCENCRAIDYSARVGAILTYLKFRDDWQDEKSIKALFGMMCFWRAVRKAKKVLPDVYSNVREHLTNLSKLENENCQNADMMADVFGKLLAECMKAPFVEEKNFRQLYEMGYQLGRWIYLIDAIHDFEKDLKKKNYNPFSVAYNNKKELAENNNLPLTLTLDAVSKAYMLLDVKKNSEIIENIIYLGLLKKQTEILEGTDENGSV